MKALKTLGLTTFAAMALLGLAGASAAQASTSLYTDAAKTTPYAAGTTVDLSLKSGSSTTLTDGSGNQLVTCTGSTAKGKTAAESGETISISLETLSWSGCGTTTDTVANGSLEINWTSGSSGEVIGRKTEWTVQIFGVSCTYGFGEGVKLGTIAGGSEPVLKIASAPLKKIAGGFLCPEKTTLDAEYVFTEPHAIYVGRGVTTTLYTDAPKTTPYAAGTVLDLSLKAGTSTKLTTSEGSEIATCAGSTAKGKTAAESGEALSVTLETLSWSSCSQTTDTVANGSLEINWTSGTSGEVIGKQTEWTLGIFGVSCTYGFGEGVKLGTIAGGSEPVLKIASAALKKTAGSVLCPEKTTLDAEYVFTEPHAIYVGRGVTTSLYTDAAKTTPYAAGTTVDLSLKSGSSTTLTDGSGNQLVTCTGSTAKGKTAAESGETISISLETLSWSGCGTTTDTVANGSLEINWTSGSSGEVIGRKTEWTVQIFGVSCTYGFGEGVKLGTIAGGSEPVLKIASAPLKKIAGGFLCPEKTTLDAEYVFTEPHAIYVGS